MGHDESDISYKTCTEHERLTFILPSASYDGSSIRSRPREVPSWLS